MKIFVSNLIAAELSKEISIEVLPLKSYRFLDFPVNTHADMLVFVIDKTIFCYEDYYLENRKIFNVAENEGYEIVFVSKRCGKNYPDDVGLNIFRMGRVLFANLSYIANEIVEYANENGYALVNTNQGYAACSTLVLNDENAITADKSIYKAIKSQGKNVTLISPNGIQLDGYNCGFIGGASCVIDKTVYFFGNIKNHPSYDIICGIIIDLGMAFKIISSLDVYDFGGIRLI